LQEINSESLIETRAMSELFCIARLKIDQGKLDEFKQLAVRCVELVRAQDTGTLQYELYFNSDNTECIVIERYRDSQALLDHVKNLGDTMGAILRTCSGSGEVCGTPSPELIEQLKGSSVQVYTPFLAS
jgi:quinol monooxygenase YgiN